MRSFDERKLEIFKRSKERIAVKKNRRNIFIACISLCLCISIVSAVLIPRLDVFGGNNSSSEGTENQNFSSKPNTSSDRVYSGGCATNSETEGTTSNNVINLMAEVNPNKVSSLNDINSQNIKATNFALRLFKASQTKGKNTLVSPLSVLSALAMTANGAEGKTLSQMEEVLGMTRDELNLYFYSYMQDLPVGDQYKLSLANSIWFTDDSRFTVNQKFLQTNADFYGADIYKAPLNNAALQDINNWVNIKTDEMIPEIVKEMPENTVMCLLNALAFEAEWEYKFSENSVSEGTFTKEDGTKQKAVFMRHEEPATYLEDKNATGLIKYYKDKKYAFVALLPKEGLSVSEYLKTLNAQSLNALLSNRNVSKTFVSIPKFETEYEVEMSQTLQGMGMTDAFNNRSANFTGLGKSTNGYIFITKVVHKTFISVAETGTKAGAATAVFFVDECAPVPIVLDRPFVYMLIDCENNVPFFIGTMMDLNS